MSICTVTGTVRSIAGDLLAGATLRFERRTLTGQDGAVVQRGIARATADDAGQVSIDLYTGVYTLTVIPAGQGERSGQGGMATVTVPDAAAADLSELMEQTPALTPSLVAQAKAYRDETAGLYEQTQTMLDQGLRGPSAYEVAVAAGFTGAEAEWLASLVGPQGEAGVDGQSVTVIACTDDASYDAAVTENASNPLALVIRYADG